MKYRLLPQALIDLELIGDYIAEHNPDAAIRLVNILERRWDLLTLHPFSGAPDAVEILRVLHGRRNIVADDLAS